MAVSSADKSGYKIRETDVTTYSYSWSLGPSRAVAKNDRISDEIYVVDLNIWSL